MNKNRFDVPQRQSDYGILLFFLKSVYVFFKISWPFLLIGFTAKPNLKTLFYGLIVIAVLIILGIVYSIFYYRNFLFHIDFKERKFILEKGVFSTDNIQIPFEKIQQVDIKRSILQRMIGVYSLTIETAGNKGEEVKITALNKEDAHALSDVLTTAKQQSTPIVPTDGESETKLELDVQNKEEDTVLWTHRLSILNLFKIGLTQGYLRGFLIAFGFTLSIFNRLNEYFESYLNRVLDYSQEYLETVSGDFMLSVLVLLFILLLSMVVTIGRVIINHFGLTLQQFHQRMEMSMGLKTQTKVSFQARRLQRLKIQTNPIQRRINLYEARINLAGSVDEERKSKINIPGLTKRLVIKIKAFLYSQKTLNEQTRIYKPHKAWMNRRFIVISLIVAAVWAMEVFIYEMLYWQWLLYLNIGLLAIIAPIQYYFYKTIKINISNDFLVIKQGIWNQEQEIVELYKMQGVSMRQPLWYKRRELYNLTFHTAGGDIKIRAIPQKIVKELNYILYKIESINKEWM